jgi:hypothetical protein
MAYAVAVPGGLRVVDPVPLRFRTSAPYWCSGLQAWGCDVVSRDTGRLVASCYSHRGGSEARAKAASVAYDEHINAIVGGC